MLKNNKEAKEQLSEEAYEPNSSNQNLLPEIHSSNISEIGNSSSNNIIIQNIDSGGDTIIIIGDNASIPQKKLGNKLITNLDHIEHQETELIFYNPNADYLKHLDHNIRDDTKLFYVNVILGFASIGKTFLAKRIALQYIKENKFQLIWFVNSESEDSILSSFADLAFILNINNNENRSDNIRLLYKSLETDFDSYLLIFDNAVDRNSETETPGLFRKKYFPKGLNAAKQLIITSQNQEWIENYMVNPIRYVELKNWQLEDYHSFLSQNFSKINFKPEEIDYLFHEFGGLPLPLVQAAHFMMSRNITPNKYISLLNQPYRLLEEGIPKTYNKSIVKTTIVAFNSLPDNAKTLLSFYSFFSPYDIPYDLISKTIENSTIKTIIQNNPFSSNILCIECNYELIKYSIVTISNYDKQLISFHRLIHDIVKLYIIEDKKLYSIYVHDCALILNAAFNFKFEFNEERAYKYEKLYPHLVQMFKLLDNQSLLQPDTIKELCKIGYQLCKFFSVFGNKKTAIEYAMKSLKICKENTGAVDLDFENKLNLRVGFLHIYDSNSEGHLIAEKHLNEALVYFEETKSKLVVDCLNYLGQLNRVLKNFDKAIHYAQTAISRFTQIHNLLYRNIGEAHLLKGNFNEAISNYIKAYEAVNPNNVSGHAQIEIQLGTVYGLVGNFEQQTKFHFSALEKYKKLNLEHNVIRCLYYIIHFQLSNRSFIELELLAEFNKLNAKYDSQLSRTRINLITFRIAILNSDAENMDKLFNMLKNIKSDLEKSLLWLLPFLAFIDYYHFLIAKGNELKAIEALNLSKELLGEIKYPIL